MGATPLAHVVGYEAIEQGCVARYRSTFVLVADFRSEEALQQRNKTLPRSFQADLLIIDDMGLTQLPKHASEHLFEIIMRRDENKSTLVTRTRPTEDWGELLPDAPAVAATLDRFPPHALIIPITGQSYRHQGCRDHTSASQDQHRLAVSPTIQLGSTPTNPPTIHPQGGWF